MSLPDLAHLLGTYEILPKPSRLQRSVTFPKLLTLDPAGLIVAPMNAPDSRLNFFQWWAEKFEGVRGKSRSALVLAALLAVHGGIAHADVTLSLVNNFSVSKGGTYFDGHIEDQDIYLYFTGIGASDVTYNGGTAVTAGNKIQLSAVTGGNFTLSNSVNAARVYAILGSNAPDTIPLPAGPDPVLTTNPYSFIELTTLTGGKADQSFLNQVSFPTSLSNGTKTNSWSQTTTPESVATAFNTAFPAAPYAPAAGVVVGSGTAYAPYAATTVTRSAGATQTPIDGHRVIAASNVNLPPASPPPQAGTGYTNVPGFDSYLGWLKEQQPNEGWKFGYNSPGFENSTYVGYLKVTGTTGNYGLELSDFTYGGTFNSAGTITSGTSVSGTITYASNNSEQNVYGTIPYTGNWTDMILFGATDPTGAAVVTSGTLGDLSVASVLYTVSASIGTGILGSDAYTTHDSNTDFFFKSGFTHINALTDFFANSTFGGVTMDGFYDKYWYTMLEAGGVGTSYAGYFTPYDDHFDGLDVLMASDSGTLTWELGVALQGAIIPEPSALALLMVSWTVLGPFSRRRRERPPG